MEKNHETLIILDWDHTLFNTTLFVEKLKEELENKGVSSEEFDDKRKFVKSCCKVIDIDRFAKELGEVDSNDVHEAVRKVLKVGDGSFVFNDVESFVDGHKDSADILIVTQGDNELQEEKLKQTGFFSKVPHIITKDKKSDALKEIVGEYKTVHYIDDKPKDIDDVKTAFPQIKAYFLKRPEDKPYADEPLLCECANKEITDLNFTLE